MTIWDYILATVIGVVLGVCIALLSIVATFNFS